MAGEFVIGGRSVAAGRGWDWIASGWELFKKQVGMWIALLILFIVVMTVIAVVPVLGGIASTLLTPVLSAGLFVAAKAADEGRSLEFGQLFAGFREPFVKLVLVGAIYLGIALLVALVVGLATGVSILAIAAGTVPEIATPAAALAVVLAFLVMLALLLPVIMAIWFAPPLVAFHGRGAIQAMQESFLGCLKNIVPFLVYGVVFMVLGILASIPLGLGWLVLGPVLAASAYTSYKDIFTAA
jgi:uncharacterized membrane protein